MQDKITGKFRGFGFVTFENPTISPKVLSEVQVMDGKIIDCKKALARNKNETKQVSQYPTARNNTFNIRSGASNLSTTSDINLKYPPQQQQKKESVGTPIQISEKINSRRIFVGGLPHTIDDDAFEQYFRQFGLIEGISVMKNKKTGKARGFGFVTFVDQEAVDIVLQNVDRHQIHGKWVECQIADPNPHPEQSDSSSLKLSKMVDQDQIKFPETNAYLNTNGRKNNSFLPEQYNSEFKFAETQQKQSPIFFEKSYNSNLNQSMRNWVQPEQNQRPQLDLYSPNKFQLNQIGSQERMQPKPFGPKQPFFANTLQGNLMTANTPNFVMKNPNSNRGPQEQYNQNFFQQQQLCTQRSQASNGLWLQSMKSAEIQPQFAKNQNEIIPYMITDFSDKCNYGVSNQDPNFQTIQMLYQQQEDQKKAQFLMTSGFKSEPNDPLLLLDKSLISLNGQPQAPETGRIDPKYYSPRMY